MKPHLKDAAGDMRERHCVDMLRHDVLAVEVCQLDQRPCDHKQPLVNTPSHCSIKLWWWGARV